MTASVTRRGAHTRAAGGGGRWDLLLSAASGGKSRSDEDALDLVEGDLVGAAVVEAGGAEAVAAIFVSMPASVARLMELASAADADVPDGMDIPAELERSEDRLKAIAAAKAKLEARAAERHAAEQAEYEAKRSKREARAQTAGTVCRRAGPPTAGTGSAEQRPDQSYR